MLFRKAEIDDYDKIHSYFALYGENSCQHSFVNMFTMYEKYGAKYCEQDGFLYILRSHMCSEGIRTYLFPMGGGDEKKAVEAVMEDAHRNNGKVCFKTITESKCRWLLREFPDKFRAEEVRDYTEYIHLSDNLANLPGSKFAKKRYDVNRIRRVYGQRLEEEFITEDSKDEVLEFEKKWLETLEEPHNTEALRMEYREIEKQLAHFDELKISGIIVRIDKEMQGFVYGTPLSEDCYDVLIEKGNREIEDIYRVLHQDIVRKCAMDYKYINREEDVGVLGLRKAKLLYKPDILLNKCIAREI